MYIVQSTELSQKGHHCKVETSVRGHGCLSWLNFTCFPVTELSLTLLFPGVIKLSDCGLLLSYIYVALNQGLA